MPKPQVTVFDGMDFPPYEFKQYPMMVYKGEATKLETMIVNDDDEWTAAKKTGWVASPGDLGKASVDSSAPTKKITV